MKSMVAGEQYILLASERSERNTIRGVQIRAGAVYIYVWRYVCHNSSACHAYVMWAELGHCHFLLCASSFKRGSQWKRHRHYKCFKLKLCAWV